MKKDRYLFAVKEEENSFLYRYYNRLRINKRGKEVQIFRPVAVLPQTVFMQDDSPPQIASYVKNILKRHFIEERIIAMHFVMHLIPWCISDPQIWIHTIFDCVGLLVSRDNPRNLLDHKDSISQAVFNISMHTLLSTLKHAILQFQRESDNYDHHV